jgi:hypothetical protein
MFGGIGDRLCVDEGVAAVASFSKTMVLWRHLTFGGMSKGFCGGRDPSAGVRYLPKGVRASGG